MDDVELAVAAAAAGAEVVRNRFGTPLTRIRKGGGDFATDVDVEAERTIVELLLANRPTDGVVAEESGRVGAPGADRHWLVDPLCGTLNFAAGTGPVAVNVALCEGTRSRRRPSRTRSPWSPIGPRGPSLAAAAMTRTTCSSPLPRRRSWISTWTPGLASRRQ